MIVEELHALAIAEELVGDPNYQLIPIPFAICLDRAGQFLGYEDLRVDIAVGRKLPNGKPCPPHLVSRTHSIPRQSYRSGKVSPPRFLADNLKYIFGNDGDTSDVEAGLRCTDGYRKQVQACCEATGHPGVKAIAAFLNSSLPGVLAHQPPKDANPGNQFLFKVDGKFIHDAPKLQKWWATQNAIPAPKAKQVKGAGKQIPTYHCIITGVPFHTLEKFPSSPGIPGASNTAKLLSMDKRSFWSHGWQKNENAPVCRDAAIKVATALTRLLSADPKDGRGNPLPKRNIRLPGEIGLCYWAIRPSPLETAFLDQFWTLLCGDTMEPKEGEKESPAKGLIESIWRGEEAVLDNPARFCAFLISGSMTRGSMRGWVSTKFNDVLANLSQHFRDMKMVRSMPGNPPRQVISFRKLMLTLLKPQTTKEPITRDQTAFLLAILNGTLYPSSFLAKALQRTRAEIAGREKPWVKQERLDARASLIKAVMNRRRRTNPAAAARYQELEPDMNPANCTQDGYAMGALMAVLERLQQAALGQRINSTVVDRFFSSASCNPRAAFSKLLKTARYHYDKTKRAKNGGDRVLGWRCDRLIDWLVQESTVENDAGSLPAVFGMEQQGQFVVAYHQMKFWMWMKKEERQAWEASHPDCPQQFRWAKEVVIKEDADEETPVTV